MNNKPLICIVGPTASGKTALSLCLAELFNGEIVSADSMQIYKGMSIGTAKPSIEERRGIPHHMMDIVEPWETYSVARYVNEAASVIDAIHEQNKLPIVVGGTGLYVDSLLRGMDFAAQPSDEQYRNELEKIAEAQGGEVLLEKLRCVDAEQAELLHANDHKRIIRALEVYHVTGEKISQHNERTRNYESKYNACIIGITYRDRQRLYDRINMRVDMMLADGILDELKALLDQGLDKTVTAFQAIGYKELMPYIEGNCSLDEAVEALKQATRRYAKRQLTWFRRNPNINWIYADEAENFSDVLQASTGFIRSSGIIEGEISVKEAINNAKDK